MVKQFYKFFSKHFVFSFAAKFILTMKFRFLFIILFSFIVFHSISQDKYKIKVQINGYHDSLLLLTTYYGDKVMLLDTAFADNPGSFTFEGDSLLPPGIFMAVSSKKVKLFEFIVNDKQQFSMQTDTSDYSMDMNVKGSPENKLFFDYVKFNELQFENSKPLRDSLKILKPGDTGYDRIKIRVDSINKVAANYKLNIINSKPDLFLAKLFNAMRDVDIPDSILHSRDSVATYRYYKDHYWDYFDLSDARLLHTPLLAKKVEQYFNQLVPIHPDSVIKAIDMVISKARPSKEVVSWLVWHFTAEYQNPKYMGFDVVFIHLADEYFKKEEILRATPSVTKSIIEQADKMRPLVLGSPAPNLILIDTSGNYKSFNSMTNDYILIFFWDYDCGNCKRELDELKALITTTPFDFGIYAVCVNNDLDKWKETIVERGYNWTNVNGTRSVTQDFHDLYDSHSTPAIFLLDKNRNIIAKQISASQINRFLQNHEKREMKGSQ